MKKVVVMGGGESGTGAAILAIQQGYDVFLTDNSQIPEANIERLNAAKVQWEEGGHSEDRLLAADELIKSPGIPDDLPLINKIRKKGIPVVSEIEFASRYTDAYLIGITGSNGKTTTSTLLHHIMKKAGMNVVLAGNVGNSFAYSVATEDPDYYVLELSSFQLDGIEDFHPKIAILLNITPDHLERYHYNMDEYVQSKFRITKNLSAKDFFIYNVDDNTITETLSTQPNKAIKAGFSIQKEVQSGAYLEEDNIIINATNPNLTMSIHQLALQGKHNLYNSMAAGIAARVLEIKKDLIRESLSDFQNIEHRLEFVARIHGISFINDSKATNVNSTWYALESIQAPIIWIAGGVDKGK